MVGLSNRGIIDLEANGIFGLTDFLDEHLGHYLWHAGLLGLTGLLVYREWHRPAELSTVWWVTIVGGHLRVYPLCHDGRGQHRVACAAVLPRGNDAWSGVGAPKARAAAGSGLLPCELWGGLSTMHWLGALLGRVSWAVRGGVLLVKGESQPRPSAARGARTFWTNSSSRSSDEALS
jgi:hypothetical protein